MASKLCRFRLFSFFFYSSYSYRAEMILIGSTFFDGRRFSYDCYSRKGSASKAFRGESRLDRKLDSTDCSSLFMRLCLLASLRCTFSYLFCSSKSSAFAFSFFKYSSSRLIFSIISSWLGSMARLALLDCCAEESKMLSFCSEEAEASGRLLPSSDNSI